MNVVKRILLSLLAGVLLAGCKIQPEPAPEELYGVYKDRLSGRGTLELNGEILTVDWVSPTLGSTHYEIPYEYKAKQNILSYTDAIRVEIDPDGTTTEVYKDGTGYFTVGDGTLSWHNDLDVADDVVFIKQASNP
ncbi:MAG: hypothetical protein IJ225_08960 [Solobacterium sp.]|nr:hypothetical protein [Solobacterium sp.]